MTVHPRVLSRRLLFAGAAVSACLFAGSAVSGTINHGDFSDIPPGSVMYLDVTESSSSVPLPPERYGAPSIFGNNLDFDPSNFGAVAVGALPGADLVEAQLNLDFMAVNGTGLNSLFISEGGDYTLAGSGTSGTNVNAGLFAQVDITHVDGVQLATAISVVGTAQFTADLAANPGLNQAWTNSLLLDFGPALTNAGFDPSINFATKGDLVINNTLVAISESNPDTVAQITKKEFDINPGVVPEPTSLALIATGILLACPRRRRR